jgi:DNA ligase (NAD+)
LQKIKHWVGDSKNGVGILGIGDKIIEELVESRVVKNSSDLYRLTVDSLKDVKIGGKIRVGESRARTIIDNIQKKSRLPLNIFLGSLGITFLGRTRAAQIIEACESLRTIDGWLDYDNLSKTLNDFTGEVTANTIVDGFRDERSYVNSLLEVVSIGDDELPKVVVPVVAGEKRLFDGLSFCFTGTRDGLERVEALGGFVKSGVSKGLDFLVQKDPLSVSGKSKKAEQYGTKIISVDFLFKVMDEGLNIVDAVKEFEV